MQSWRQKRMGRLKKSYKLFTRRKSKLRGGSAWGTWATAKMLSTKWSWKSRKTIYKTGQKPKRKSQRQALPEAVALIVKLSKKSKTWTTRPCECYSFNKVSWRLRREKLMRRTLAWTLQLRTQSIFSIETAASAATCSTFKSIATLTVLSWSWLLCHRWSWP